MTKRQYAKYLRREGTPKKLAWMLASAAGEIFVLVKKAAKLEKDGRHEAAEAVLSEVVAWLNGMNRFVEAMAKMLTDDVEE